MVLTKIPGSSIVDGTITSTDILDSTITNAKMALSPANASNLSSGSVPAAQLTLAPDPDLSPALDDIALLAFKTQTNGNLARYNLVDQSVDAFEDASGISAGDSTNEYRNSAGKYYSGQDETATFSAHTTPGSATWTCPAGITSAEVLVVAGGGGGGGSDTNGETGGGAGGGGVLHNATYTTVPAVVYDITVGSGGSAGGNPSTEGSAGGNSVFNVNAEGSGATMTAMGGGAGGKNDGYQGGSGAGAGRSGNPGGGSTQTNNGGGTGYGNAGGASWSGGQTGGGGGGGAGVEGSVGTSGAGAAGGAGKLFSNFTSYGVSGYFAGGGGGGGGTSGGAAGSGGGGAGGYDGSNVGAGTANTGGGGGGMGDAGNAGAGGSGTVIIRYLTLGSVTNMTLESTTTTAQDAPTKGDIVFTYTDGAGTAVLGTNITAEYSADAGSTWTNFSIAAGDTQGTSGGHTIVTKSNVALTSTSGTSMRYRIKTLVQSASINTRIHAVSLGWS